MAALFKNMGRLLVAAFDHRLYEDILGLMETESLSPARASIKLLGCSFENLAESVLSDWQIPESIIKAMAPIPAGVLKPARTRTEWIQQVAAFSVTAAALIPQMNELADDAASRALVARFGTALDLDQQAIASLFATVAEQTRVLTSTSDLNAFADSDVAAVVEPEQPTQQASDAMLLADMLMQSEPALEMNALPRHASGKPINARELLQAGVQDISEMMASGRCKMQDLVLLALETLYRSMGFRFATVCVRDIKTGQFRARIALGEKNVPRQADFIFSVGEGRDLFSLALSNNADLLIADATASNIAGLVPPWHRRLLPDARSFIVLPLVVQDKPFGLFYGDRIATAPEGVPPDETALIKMLKGQVIAALTPR